MQMELGAQCVAATGMIRTPQSFVTSCSWDEKESQNKPRFLDWALFPFIGAMSVAEEMKKTYCFVKKTSGRVGRVLGRRRLLSRVAFPRARRSLSYASWVGEVRGKAEWKSTMLVSGGLSVMTSGMKRMQK